MAEGEALSLIPPRTAQGLASAGLFAFGAGFLSTLLRRVTFLPAH